MDNKAATKRIKALYANKAKEELLGNEGVVEEALSIYGAVNEERNHFVVNTILKVFIKSGGHRTVHRLWSDVMSIDGVSLPLALKCAVGPPSATASDLDIAASLEVLGAMKDRGVTTLSEYERSWYSVSASALISKCRSLSELQSVHRAVSLGVATVTERDDIFMATALMKAYSKWGAVDAAESVFEGVPEWRRDAVSMNAMLTVFAENERAEKAMAFYDAMRERVRAMSRRRESESESASEDVFDLLALRVCGKEHDEERGRRLIADIERRRVLERRPLSKELVHCMMWFHGQCGRMEAAQSLFAAMPPMSMDAVSIGTMMGGLIQNGESAAALRLYAKYEDLSNDTAKLLALKCCAAMDDAESIGIGNALCSKLSAPRNGINLLNAAIAFKGFQGDIAGAKELFEAVDGDKKDIVTLNSMMTALNDNGHFEESLALYDEYGHLVEAEGRARMEMALRNEAAASISGRDDVAHILAIGACANLRDFERGKAVHRRIESEFGFDFKVNGNAQRKWMAAQFVNVGNALIAFYGRCGDVAAAQRLFAEMDGLHSVSSLNSMMKMHLDSGRSDVVLALYDDDRIADGQRDAISHFTAIRACIERSDYPRGNTICDQVAASMTSSDGDGDDVLSLKTTMIDFYGFFGVVDAAKMVFDAVVRAQRLNSVALNSMMKNLVLNDLRSEALALYDEHREQRDAISQCIALSICIETADELKGRRIADDAMAEVARSRLSADGEHQNDNVLSARFLENSVMKFHGAFKGLERARAIFHSLGRRRDTVNVNTMMEALCANDAHSECLQLALELIEGRIDGAEPDPVSFVMALRASTRCCSLRRGLQIHDVLKRDFPSFLDEEPVAVHLVAFYGKCGMTTMAEAVFTRFVDRHSHSHSHSDRKGHSLEIWHSVLTAFGRNGDHENTLRLFRRLTADPPPKGLQSTATPKSEATTFVVMMSALAHCGRTAEAAHLWSTQIADDALKWDCFVVSALVDCFARNGQLDDAQSIVTEYTDGHKGPHHSAMWISLLNGAKLFGHREMAEALYQRILDIPQFDEQHLTAASVIMSN